MFLISLVSLVGSVNICVDGGGKIKLHIVNGSFSDKLVIAGGIIHRRHVEKLIRRRVSLKLSWSSMQVTEVVLSHRIG